MKLILILLIIFLSPYALAEVEYVESGDDFSNGKVYTLKISTAINEPAIMYLSCYPNNKLSIQLAPSEVMFPDSSDENGMKISTTYKFDKAASASTSNWHMNMMKYYSSWYDGDKVSFINSAIRSTKLNVRLNKRNDIFKFNISDASKHLKKILNKCGA